MRVDDRDLLLIPGPVTVTDDVLAALSLPIRPHYGVDWADAYRSVTAKVANVFLTREHVLLLFGPGMAAVEMAIRSTLAPGDEVVVTSNGMFGDRMVEVARAAGLEVHTVRPPLGEPIDPDVVRKILRERRGIRAVGLVHHETILGLLNPLEEICAVARDYDVLTIVDAVSSLGGVELRVDEWGIDLCISVANKCLGAPIGVARISVSRRAWDAVEDGRSKSAGWYLNLSTWRHYEEDWGAWHPHPTTMPTNVIEALAVAVDQILAEGLDAYQARHAAAASQVREGVRELGFELLVPDEVASPVTTAVRGRPGMDVSHYIDWLRERHRLRIAGGIGELRGVIFRIGHMGRATEPEAVSAYLAATAEYLEEAVLP